MLKNFVLIVFTICLIQNQAFSFLAKKKSKVTDIFAEEEAGKIFAKITEKEDGLTTGTAYKFALSPDNTKVAFISMKTGNGDIYMKSAIGGKGITQLTFKPVIETQPSFSPDGLNLVYVKTGEILLSSTEKGKGVGIRKIVYGDNPSFSPDGNKITFDLKVQVGSYYNKAFKMEFPIYAYFLGITDLITLHTFEYSEGQQPCFTPDGKSLVFVRPAKTGEQYYSLWTLNLETGAEMCILEGKDFACIQPDISPDGKKIVFARTIGANAKKKEKDNWDIWTIEIDGSNLTQYTFHSADDYSPRWSSDGKSIYFLSGRGSAKGEDKNIWRMDLK